MKPLHCNQQASSLAAAHKYVKSWPKACGTTAQKAMSLHTFGGPGKGLTQPNRDHKALNGATLGGLDISIYNLHPLLKEAL